MRKKRRNETRLVDNGDGNTSQIANTTPAGNAPAGAEQDAGAVATGQPPEPPLGYAPAGGDSFTRFSDPGAHGPDATSPASGDADSAMASLSEGADGAAEDVPESYGEVLPVPESSASGTIGLSINAIPDELGSIENPLVAEGEIASLPHPDVFNAYPIEVQRKIMEWADRDVKARRDDESRRQDELMRAKVERERRRQSIPAIISVLAIICGTVSGIATGNPLFPIAFLIVVLAIIGARVLGEGSSSRNSNAARKPSPRTKPPTK